MTHQFGVHPPLRVNAPATARAPAWIMRSNTRPWQHQIDACGFLYNKPAGALFSDMGTGKSKVVVDLICNIKPKLTLVIGPLKSIEDGLWEREFQNHGYTHVEVLSLGPRQGKVKDRAARIRWAALMVPINEFPLVIAINYDTLDQQSMKDALLSVPWDLIVLDESHRIKAPSGVRSRFLAQLGKQAGRRMILTGTPNADKPLDVWAQYRFLDPSIFGRYKDFKDQYAIIAKRQTRTGQWFDEILGYRDLDGLAERMSKVAFRVTADVLDLPPQHDVILSVRLSDAARVIYDRMEKESVIGQGEEAIIADNTLTQYLRLQEITSGYLRADEPDPNTGVRPTRRFDTSKAEALIEKLTDLEGSEPAVVFYRFTADADLLREMINQEFGPDRSVMELSGRRNELGLWKGGTGQRGGVLLVQIAAGSEAIDLTQARYVFYYSPDFSLSHYEQSRKRVHRPGQLRPVTYYHLVAESTVDESIQKALHDKQDVATSISDYLKDKHRTEVAIGD